MLSSVLVVFGLYFFIFAERVGAIVLLPALILIPLAKLLAIVIAGLSVPITSLGVFIAKITKNKEVATKIVLAMIIVTVVLTAIILKLQHPDNPWF